VRYAVEKWNVPGYNDRDNMKEIESIREIILLIKSTIRDFDLQFVDWSIDYVNNRVPVLSGFTKGTYDIGMILPRYESYAIWPSETGADAISIGISMENTATDWGYLENSEMRGLIESAGVDIYLGGSPDLTPIPTGKDLDPDLFHKTLTGRFAQYEAMPEELRVLTHKCDTSTCNKLWCMPCAYQRGYETFVADGKTGRDFDLYCAERGSYGPFRSLANKDTYTYRGEASPTSSNNRWNYLADAAGLPWPSVVV